MYIEVDIQKKKYGDTVFKAIQKRVVAYVILTLFVIAKQTQNFKLFNQLNLNLTHRRYYIQEFYNFYYPLSSS